MSDRPRLRASHPRFRRTGNAPVVVLTDADVAILKHIYRHRFMRADDLYRLLAPRTPDRISRRLAKLYRSHYVDRPIAQIDRFRPGGSQPLVYGLDNAGARYLQEHCGMPIGASDWRARNRQYTRENLDHTLAVAHFLIGVEVACRERRDIEFIAFDEILAVAPEEARKAAAPMTWAVPVQWSSGRAEVRVSPDAIFGLRLIRASAKPLQAYFFLEIDRGTMTIMPSEQVRDSEAFLYRATVLRKLLTYAESWRQAAHKKQFGIPAAHVLMITTSEARAASMRRAALDFATGPLRLPPALFLFGVSKDVVEFDDEYSNAAGVSTRLIPS